MSIGSATWALLLSFGVTSILLPFVWVILRRRKVLDVPNDRSSHTLPTPRGAGIAQLGGLCVGLFGSGLPTLVLFGIAGFSVIGAFDDWRSTSAKYRLMGQVSLAAVLMIVAMSLNVLVMTYVLAAAGVITLVLLVNVCNFMDGINGISAIHGVVFGITYFAIFSTIPAHGWASLGLALIGISVAFFPWNFRIRAQMFLGDSGSYLLGGATGFLVIGAWVVGVNPIVALVPISIYFCDVSATLFRRLVNGENLIHAHRDHTYQHLVLGDGHIVGQGSLLAG